MPCQCRLDDVREHWSAIRSRVSRGPVQCRYDYRLTTLHTTVLEAYLKRMFQEHTYTVNANLSYGFFLWNKEKGRYNNYNFSCNCCGRYLDEPSLIPNLDNFGAFMKRIRETDALGMRILDECHLLYQTYHQSFDRLCGLDPPSLRQEQHNSHRYGKGTQQFQNVHRQHVPLPLFGSSSSRRRTSIGTGGEDAVRGVCSHGRLCRGYAA